MSASNPPDAGIDDWLVSATRHDLNAPPMRKRFFQLTRAQAEQEFARELRVSLKLENLIGWSFDAERLNEIDGFKADEITDEIRDQPAESSSDLGAEGAFTVKTGSQINGAVATATFSTVQPLEHVTLELDAEHAEALYSCLNDRIGPTKQGTNKFYDALWDLGIALRRAGVTQGRWTD